MNTAVSMERKAIIDTPKMAPAADLFKSSNNSTSNSAVVKLNSTAGERRRYRHVTVKCSPIVPVWKTCQMGKMINKSIFHLFIQREKSHFSH